MSKLLPATPNLEHLRKQAKDLLASFRDDDPAAVSLFQQHAPRLASSTPAIAASGLKLSDAQLVLAREYGFTSWPKLKSHVDSVSTQATPLPQQDLDEAMIRAANKNKDLKQVKKLLDAGANVNGRLAEVGTSALGWAACGGRIELMEFLLSHGADVNAPGSSGFSVLSCAAMLGQVEATRFLLANGADVNPVEPNAYGVMLSAAFGANEEIVCLLIDAGSAVNIRANQGNHGNFWFNFPYCGETPLHYAMAYGSKRMIQALLDAGADSLAKTRHGETPFHWAGRHQRPKEIMKWLRTIA